MKTNLNVPITNSEEAKNYIVELFNNDESYHPEDSAFDIVWNEENPEHPTDEELKKMDENMELVYKFADFNPCEILCDLLDLKNNIQDS